MKKSLFSILFLLFPLLIQAQVPSSSHVVVVLEENHSFSSVIGNSAMPFLNSLASQNALATQYFSDTHPSIGNYFMLTTGQIITNNDAFTGTVDVDNIIRHLLSAGKTWKSYAESLPSVGYVGGDTGPYLQHHNPFTYFSDVVNSTVQRLNLVPFTQFATDLNNGQLPNFSFVIPNVNDDAHNGSLQQADAWLQQNIGPVFNNPEFQKDGLLIVVFDESFDTDTAFGGGQVAAVMAGPLVKKGFRSATHYQHQNTLRTVMAALGMDTFPGAAASVAPMSDMLVSGAPSPTPTPMPTPTPSPTPTPTPTPSPKPNPTPTPTPPPTATPNPIPGACAASGIGVTVCSPKPGSTDSSPVGIQAAAQSTQPITAMAIYVDNNLAFLAKVSSVNTNLSMSAGSHNVVVQAWDATGAVFKTPVAITVGSSIGGTCAASTVGVTVCTPAPGSSPGSPVHFAAAAKSSMPITAMRIYVDGVSQFLTLSNSLNTSIPITAGSHLVVVQAWDSTGAVFKNSQTLNIL